MAAKEGRESLGECEMAPGDSTRIPSGAARCRARCSARNTSIRRGGPTRDVDQASFSVSDSSPALRITTLNFRPLFFWFAKNLATCLPTAGTLKSPVG